MPAGAPPRTPPRARLAQSTARRALRLPSATGSVTPVPAPRPRSPPASPARGAAVSSGVVPAPSRQSADVAAPPPPADGAPLAYEIIKGAMVRRERRAGEMQRRVLC